MSKLEIPIPIPIYCINLQERPDRKKTAINEFKKINIDKKNVIFLEFHKHKKGGRYGCYDSHVKVWYDFYKNHKDTEMCVVFEDDFKVTENSETYVKKAIPFIQENRDEIDILFLHDNFIKYNPDYTNRNDINNKHFTNGYGKLTHAYIITRKYIKSIIKKTNNSLREQLETHFDIDMNFNKNNLLHSEKFYFCNEVVFLQDNSKSDNYTHRFEEILRVITSNQFAYNASTSCMKVINFSCGFNDDKTKKIFFILNKKYTI